MFKLTSNCAGAREAREECVRWVWDEPMLSVRLIEGFDASPVDSVASGGGRLDQLMGGAGIDDYRFPGSLKN